MFKNVASQKITLFAFIPSTGLPKTGDAANITAYVSKDDGTLTVLTDTSATEVDATNGKGLYLFDVAQAETNADKLVLSAKSSTSDVAIVPVTIFTRAPNAGALSIDSSGRVLLQPTQTGVTIPTVTNLTNVPSGSPTAGDVADAVWDEATSGHLTAGTAGKLLTDIASYIDTEIAAIKAKTDNLPAAPAAVGDIPTAIQNADALLDRSNGIETSLTPRQAMRLFAAAMAGKVSGAGTTTITFRNVGDSKARITATVDASGNRSAVTTDAT